MTEFFFVFISLVLIAMLFTYAILCFIHLDLSPNHITFLMFLIGFVSAMFILLNIQIIRDNKIIDKLQSTLVKCGA